MVTTPQLLAAVDLGSNSFRLIVGRVEETDAGSQIYQVDALRDQVSGISLDEEAVNLLKYQKAYEANARFFRAIDATLDTLLGMASTMQALVHATSDHREAVTAFLEKRAPKFTGE